MSISECQTGSQIPTATLCLDLMPHDFTPVQTLGLPCRTRGHYKIPHFPGLEAPGSQTDQCCDEGHRHSRVHVKKWN